MVYTDAEAAELYEVLNPWSASDDWYLARVLAARSVLDVGCGTGSLLRRARASGHDGRLVGVDPDRTALDVARRTPGVDWVESTAASMTFEREFDLVLMAGHTFQFLVDDDDLRVSLSAIARALVPGGVFAFETRNPAVREWESWSPVHPVHVVDPRGRPLRIGYDVADVTGDVVTVTEATCSPDGTVLRTDRASLRFLPRDALDRFLTEAGLVVEAQHGGWAGEQLEEYSSEIVTTARAPGARPGPSAG